MNHPISQPLHHLELDALLTSPSIQSCREGLTTQEAQERLRTSGLNRLASAPPVPSWRKLLSQFQDLVVWILVVAAIIAGAMGEWADTAAILAIVIVNGVIGFLQEEKAGKALDALQRMSAPSAKVRRDGIVQVIPASENVVGDRIELEAGDHVPADARLLQAFAVRVQEAALTGESQPVDKSAEAVVPPDAAIADRSNTCFMGTILSNGKASAIVVATGMQTELGQIAHLLQNSPRELTPLQVRLAELGKILIVLCLLIVALIFVLEIRRGGRVIDVLLLSVSIAVAAVPEGLPAVVTMTLAVGLQRMVRRNAIVRKLPSVETLGSVTVICSDKTGTLTRNEMTVCQVHTANHSYRVSGGGYEPRGEFIPIPPENFHALHDGHGSPPQKEDSLAKQTTESHLASHSGLNHDLVQLLTIAARCNNAQLIPPTNEHDPWQVIGDPTEGALVVAALKAGISTDLQHQPTLMEFPFDSERKAMTVILRREDGQVVMFTKGAPEVVLAKSLWEYRDRQLVELTLERRQAIMNRNSAMASQALRVLAVAFRYVPDVPASQMAEEELVFVGLLGMIDPPREEVLESVQRCRTAGIRPIMITGDHPQTAMAIAQQLQIANSDQQALTGNELDRLSESERKTQVERVSVYARVSAEHKLQIVNALKANSHVVAMTGDGVNDAPAIKSADIGIAMGITGTDVTKEASDMVLADDNFASIVSAIEEGRGIFENIQKSIHYLLACNIGEVLLMLFATLAGWPMPLIAIQILWINLVTDGLPALALGMEPPDKDIMARPPRAANETFINWQRGAVLLMHGILIATVSIAGFWIVYQGEDSRLASARTTTFCIMAFSQLFFAIGCRSQRYTMPELGPFSNPYLFAGIAFSIFLQVGVVGLAVAHPIFKIESHLTWEWMPILLLSLLPVTIIEVTKLIAKAFRPKAC